MVPKSGILQNDSHYPYPYPSHFRAKDGAIILAGVMGRRGCSTYCIHLLPNVFFSTVIFFLLFFFWGGSCPGFVAHLWLPLRRWWWPNFWWRCFHVYLYKVWPVKCFSPWCPSTTVLPWHLDAPQSVKYIDVKDSHSHLWNVVLSTMLGPKLW